MLFSGNFRVLYKNGNFRGWKYKVAWVSGAASVHHPVKELVIIVDHNHRGGFQLPRNHFPIILSNKNWVGIQKAFESFGINLTILQILKKNVNWGSPIQFPCEYKFYPPLI